MSPKQQPTNVNGNPLLQAQRLLVEAENNRKKGKLKVALQQCQEILRHYPNYVGALHCTGLIYLATGDANQAAQKLAIAAALDPTDAEVLITLGTVYGKIGADNEAEKVFERAVECAPDRVNPIIAFGLQLKSVNEFERALGLFNKALEKDPKNTSAWLGLAAVQLELGQKKDSAKSLLQSLKDGSPSLNTVRLLTQYPPESITVDLGKLLETAEKSSKELSQVDRSNRDFARANILIEKGSLTEGYDLLKSANAKRFNPAQIEKTAKRSYSNYLMLLAQAKPLPVKTSKDFPTTIQILGPSRSGKSTIESLLGTSPLVKLGYETKMLRQVLRKTYAKSGLPPIDHSVFLPQSAEQTFRDTYKDELLSRTDGKLFYTMTGPKGIQETYKLASIVPNMRFILVKRDVDDVVYRMFRTVYGDGNNYTYDLEAARGYVSWYYEMQDLLAKLLPDQVLRVNYEEMVQDPQKIANDAREFCGISGDFGELPTVYDDRGASADFMEYLKIQV